MEPLKNIIIPAIDIIGGKCVRLTKGDYNRIKEYSQSPISVAKQFEEEGAKFLHVIDLDGAKKGETVNLETILAIAKNTNLELQVGGGIRTFESAETLLNNGVAKVIIGTSALEDKRLLKRLITTFGENRIIVSIDVRKGKIATRGWLNESDMGLKVFLESVKEAGVKTIIVTDIEKDGMMNGPNFAMINEFSGNGLNVIVAGGVSSQKDIALLRKNNLAGIIIGKALYEGTVTIQEAQNDLARRIIPCMDMKDGRVVKGTCFKELKDAGDAVELGKLYSDMGADELVFLDISATLENRNTLCGLVEKIAKTINIPFTVGGGVRTVEDI
ncbi:1-(5-phosphoribosyl)-5-[(5-phosphoribosylamino)methylideneamino]imidazole-4-carboxamide isomerase, partial [Candidatus Peregrinibacteria bacterium RIFOXYB12_FULL_41_12]